MKVSKQVCWLVIASLGCALCGPSLADSPRARALGNEQLDPLFLATAQTVEESIINAMIAAEPMTGFEGHKAAAIDHKALMKLLKEHKAVVERKMAR